MANFKRFLNKHFSIFREAISCKKNYQLSKKHSYLEKLENRNKWILLFLKIVN